MKIWLVGAELFQVDRQADRHDETNNRFSQFFESAYKSLLYVALEWWRCAKSLIVIISTIW